MIKKVYCGVPMLETEKLLIRAISVDDVDFIYEQLNDKKIRKYFPSWPTDHEKVKELVMKLIENNQNDQGAFWVILLKDNKNVIGQIWLSELLPWSKTLNVGYCLLQEYSGQGLVTEALEKVIQFGFEEMGLDRIEAWHDSDNTASGRVMQKCGMKFEGTLRERGCNGDAKMYSIIKREFNN